MGRIIAIAGPAGSGKTTLGRALSTSMGARLLDLDAATADLVAQARAARPGVDEADVLREVRDARYRELLRQAATARPEGDVVVTAPFTAEVSGDGAWDDLVRQVGGEPVLLVWIDVAPEERLARLRARGATRDARLLDGGSAPAVAGPRVPCLVIDALLPTQAKVALVRSHFDNGPVPI